MQSSSPPIVIQSDALRWKYLGSGTRWARLHRLANGGTVYRIQGDAGSTFPAHTHHGGEEVFVMSGDYSDESGSYAAGAYLSYPPGSHHEPMTFGGCDLLVIWWRAEHAL